MNKKLLIGLGVGVLVLGIVIFLQMYNPSPSDSSVVNGPNRMKEPTSPPTSSEPTSVPGSGTGQSNGAVTPTPGMNTTPSTPPSSAGTAVLPESSAEITINGSPLSAEEIQSLVAIYGGAPEPGNYWYDSRSGLYGYIGGPAIGTIAPGYNLGPLSRGASGGNTGVIVNGRELTAGEVLLLQSIVGPVLQGAYWLDAAGNYGIEGSGASLGNLYAGGGASGGTSGGGDNFWSSGNFGAGNSNSDNSQGYVNVPGYGPVDYGF